MVWSSGGRLPVFTEVIERTMDYQSHGCIRLHPEDIRSLFSLVRVGTPRDLVYEPVKVAVSAGRVYLDAHPDVYGMKRPRLFDVDAALRSLDALVDWNRVTTVLATRNRTAEVVSLEVAPDRPVSKKEYHA